MTIEATENLPIGTPHGNGELVGDAKATTSAISEDLLLARLAERIEQLERTQRRLKWDSLLVAGLTTIATALTVSVVLQRRFEPRPIEVQAVANRRAVFSQAFVLTDNQGHPRAKLTFE